MATPDLAGILQTLFAGDRGLLAMTCSEICCS